MSGTTIQYGSMKLENCLIEQFNEEAVYDQSNTDILYHAFTITVSTVLVGNNVGKTIGATETSGDTVAAVESLFRTYVMHPRRSFRLSINDQTMIELTTVDADNGPKPLGFQITRAAPGSFNVSFTIRVALVQCASIGIDPITGLPVPYAEPNANVINHKWNYEETIDAEFYRRRTWNGTIRVSSIATPPDAFRKLMVPPLAAGFKRESQRFSMEPNGLNGSYQIVDVSVDSAAPFPALDWGGTHSRSLGIEGHLQHATYYVWMKGAPGVNKTQLLARCLQVAKARLGDIGPNAELRDGSGVIAKILAVDLSHAENDSRVELRMTALVTPSEKDPSALGVNLSRFGQDFSTLQAYNRQVSVQIPPYDPSLPIAAFVCYLQSPCGGPKTMPQPPSGIPSEGQEPRQLEPQGEQQPQPEPSAQYNISPEVETDPQPTKASLIQASSDRYDAYHIRTHYKSRFGKVAFPAIGDDEDAVDTVVLARHRPQTVRVVEITAERNNAPPELPSTGDIAGSDRTEHLLETHISPVTAILEPDGRTTLHCVKARYTYALTKRIKDSDEMKIGRSPFLNADGVISRFKLEDYTDDDVIEA